MLFPRIGAIARRVSVLASCALVLSFAVPVAAGAQSAGGKNNPAKTEQVNKNADNGGTTNDLTEAGENIEFTSKNVAGSVIAAVLAFIGVVCCVRSDFKFGITALGLAALAFTFATDMGQLWIQDSVGDVLGWSDTATGTGTGGGAGA